MRRNCNLELRLVPPAGAFAAADLNDGASRLNKLCRGAKESQELTIFYNGQIASCDVTELQARAIILLACREKENNSRRRASPSAQPAFPAFPSPIYSPTVGFSMSMKRSLQRFLQKRKKRILDACPYYSKKQRLLK